MKRTPLHYELLSEGAKMISMADWEMPKEFGGVEQEHVAVRTRVGLFDFSMAGLIDVKGRDALALIQRIVTNDASKMPINRIIYTAICRPDGSILSDLTVYRLGERHYLIYYAWSSVRGDQRPEYDWIMQHTEGLDVYVTELSSRYGVLALQGPSSRQLLAEIAGPDVQSLGYFWMANAAVAGAPCLVSRTGYTGELGYEILVPVEHALEVWRSLLASGKRFGLALCGLDSTYTLRLEKAYLMSFEYMAPVTPLEVGLERLVKFEKGDFVGRDALWRQKVEGISRQLVGVEMIDDFVPTRKAVLAKDGETLGRITSAGRAFSLGKTIGLGFVPPRVSASGTEVLVEAEGKSYLARIVSLPFYDPRGERVRG